MKYFPLVWAALWRRKLRTWFTLLSVVVAFFLFGMLQGVNLGIDGLYDILSTERLRSAGRINNSAMPLAHLQQIRTVEGVKAVTPLVAVAGYWQERSNTMVVLGIDTDAWFNQIYTMFELPKEQLAQMQRVRNGVLVGKALADRNQWKLGDHIPMQSYNNVPREDKSLTWEWEIVGIYEIPRAPNWATNMMANFDYVNEARGGRGKNTVMQYITSINNPQDYQKVATAIDEQFANSANQIITQSEEDYVRTLLAQIGNISYLLNGIVGAVFFTLLFLTANTMMLSVRERVPELASLKTIGFSDRALLTMVLVEVLLLCGVAGLVGLGLSSVVFPIMMHTVGPTMGLDGLTIPLKVYYLGAVVAVCVAIVSGLPPALRAMRLNIVDGLANR